MRKRARIRKAVEDKKLNQFLESKIWRSCLNAFCLMLILGACSSVLALPLHEAGREDLLSWVLGLGARFTLFGLLGLIAHAILKAIAEKDI